MDALLKIVAWVTNFALCLAANELLLLVLGSICNLFWHLNAVQLIFLHMQLLRVVFGGRWVALFLVSKIPLGDGCVCFPCCLLF